MRLLIVQSRYIMSFLESLNKLLTFNVESYDPLMTRSLWLLIWTVL